MVQFLYEQKILMYAMAGLGGLGLLVRFIVNLVYKRLIKESDNIGGTRHKSLKHIKMKFETCYKLKIGVNNVDTFVDKNLLRYKFCGFLLSTWENFCGQVLYACLLMVPIIAVIGVSRNVDQQLILSTGVVGIMSSAFLIIVDKSINLYSKKRIIRYNLLDYLENFCKVRLDQEAFHPEKLEQYRKEYFELVGSEEESAAATTPKMGTHRREEPKDEFNKRKEAKRKKELEKQALAKKREEEQKRLEAIRKEEERRRLEERKILAAKRREEERQRLEEERQALEARRIEAQKKAEEKKALNLRKQQETNKEVDKQNQYENSHDIIPERQISIVEDINTKKQEVHKEEPIHNDMNNIGKGKEKESRYIEVLRQGIEEVAAAQEINKVVKEEGPINQRKSKIKTKPMSPEEEKLVEDVLKQFFA